MFIIQFLGIVGIMELDEYTPASELCAAVLELGILRKYGLSVMYYPR
jgi:hypothetical protein